MGKVTRYLVVLVVVCTIIVLFWVFLRYIKKTDENLLTFKVERGSIEEIVRARGKVVTQKEYELSFPMNGTVKKIFVKEGQEVIQGTPLIELDKKTAELERNRLSAVLAQKEASLSKLLAGTRVEEIKVYETKVANAKNVLADAEKKLEEAKTQSVTDLQTTNDSLSNKKLSLEKAKAKAEADIASYYGDVPGVLKDAYIKADDAVRQGTEALFTNDDTANPDLTFSVSNLSYKTNAESKRITAGETLSGFSVDISDVDNASSYELDRLLNSSKSRLEIIRSFLDDLSLLLNKTINVSDATIATYKTSVNTGRTNVNTAITNINNLQQNIVVQKAANNVSINTAQSNYDDAKNALGTQKNTNQTSLTQAQTAVNAATNALRLAEDEFNLKTSGNRSQEIDSARASVQESQNQLASANEALEKSTITAPADGIVSFVAPEEHEVVTAGQMVVRFSTNGQKIEADISELDIGNISEDGTQKAELLFDAYANTVVTGKIVSVDEQEIMKEGDTYYRVNIMIDEQSEVIIRSGMSADVLIIVSAFENVLHVPSVLVNNKNGKTFVTVLDAKGKRESVEVFTGVSNGDDIEIVSGLEEGQTVVLESD